MFFTSRRGGVEVERSLNFNTELSSTSVDRIPGRQKTHLAKLRTFRATNNCYGRNVAMSEFINLSTRRPF